MKTTFSRTLFTITLLFLAAMLIVGVVFQVLAREYLTDTAVERLKNDATVISELVQAYSADYSMSEHDFGVSLTVATSVSESDAVICDMHGTLRICASHPLGCEHVGLKLDERYLAEAFQSDGRVDTGVIRGLYTDVRHIVSMPIRDSAGNPLGIVLVSRPVAETLSVMGKITEIFIFTSITVFLISIVLTFLFAKYQSTPLKDMAKAATAFGHGDLTARVQTDENHPEEIRELTLAFNNMASSLQKSEYQRQEFVANVSHELKTPMTTISGYVDGILDGTILPEKSRQYLELVSEETKRLSRLVRSMLDISRLQESGGMSDSQKSRFDILECAGQVLISFEQKINDKKLQVEVDMPDIPIFTRANPDAITQVIYNLLDNAVKFCPEGGQLRLCVQHSDSKAYISIENDGETIPPEELPLLFDRFHKIDKSRSQNRDSWGLGLYIVRKLIDSHGENISVTSREGKTSFTFTLPVVN